MKSELTIVIPTYNCASKLMRCLDSVTAQSLRPLELIVVDNASTDDTPALLQSFLSENDDEQLHITLLHESRPGAASARKCGEEHVTTPYVYFLDSDDVMWEGAAEAMLAGFHENPGAEIVLGHLTVQPPEGNPYRKRRRVKDVLINHFHHCTLNTTAYAVSTELLRRAGGWNPSLRIWDDWELGIRLLLQEPQIALSSATFSVYMQAPGSVSGENYSERAEAYAPTLQAVKAVLESSCHPEAPELLRMLPGRQMMLAAHYSREGRPDLAKPLRAATLTQTANDPWQNLSLRLAYAWRAAGLRGADTLLNILLRQ